MTNSGVLRTPSSLTLQPQAPSMAPSSPTSSTTNIVIEDINLPVRGWPSLAKTVAENADLEAFPTFADLNVKSLLYYQAELISLRQELHDAEYKNHILHVNPIYRKFAGNLQNFIAARDKAINRNEEPPEQWILIEKIRTTLEKYNAALLQYSKVAALRDADNCNISTIRDCVKNCKRGGLTGIGSMTWGDIKEGSPKERTLSELFWGLFTGFFTSPDKDRNVIKKVFQEHLVVPHKGNKPDGLTQWVKQSFIPFYDHLRERFLERLEILRNLFVFWYPAKQPTLPMSAEKRSSVSSSEPPVSPMTTDSSTSSMTENIKHYSASWIVRTTSIMTTVVACLLPTVAITVLAQVHSIGLILGLIAVFTAIFAAGLALLSSSSSRVEIFTATAAFSAVMVVFVQNQIGPQ